MKIDNEWIDKFVEIRTGNSKQIINSLKRDASNITADEELTSAQKASIVHVINRKIEQEIGYQRCLKDLKFASTL